MVDLLTGEETRIVNDPEKMKAFYEAHKNYIWCGYNSRSYDSSILKAILLDIKPAVMNDWLIEQDRKGFELDDRIGKIQLYSFDVMYNKMMSLKRLECFMGDSIEETEVPFDTTENLTPEQWEQTLYYCSHDVWETIKVMTKSKAEFFAHWSLVKEFDLPLSMISKTKAQLTAEILECEKREFNDEWDLPAPDYDCKISKYKDVYDWFFKPENRELGQKLEVQMNGATHTYGWGGSHAAKTNVFEKTNLLAVDVSSYYPSLCIEHKLLSRTPKTPKKFEEIYHKRLALKAEGKKKEQAPYKIVLDC